jgi:hypothetical protein
MGSRIEAVSGADDNSSEKAAKGAGKIRFGLRLKFSLAIIVLVATVLLTMSIYFVLREIRLLRSQIFESVQRELVHLSNTAQESIGGDELAIIASISDLKKLDYLSYAFVLNARRRDHPVLRQQGGAGPLARSLGRRGARFLKNGRRM